MQDLHWILQLLGRFHPLLVHFPIGVLVVALFLEALTIGGKRQGLREGIHWMVYLGTCFAVFSAFSGWFLMTQEAYSGQRVQYHQYLGMATAALSLLTALLLYRSLQVSTVNFMLYRLSLLFSVLTMAIAGHLGASLTHGSDYLTEVLPGAMVAYEPRQTGAVLQGFQGSEELSVSQLEELNLEVRAILAHHCYQCHSENKRKGGLALDSKAAVFQGGESGTIIVPHQPEASTIYQRITLPPDHEDVMPKKGKVLQKAEIALVQLWIEQGAPWADQTLKVFPEAPLALTKPNLPKATDKAHPVDHIIDIYFQEQGIKWPAVVDDRTFIRRAHLDVVGLLPEMEAIDAFVQDTHPDKRARLIDTLLSDTHQYTQHWLSFWNDLLRNDYSGPGFITGGRKQITDWLYQALKENKPYDQMVRELVNPSPASEGFIKGIQWRGVVNASQRTEMQAAQNIGQSLMGINVKCASCHNSFVSNLTLEQTYGFASIFADSVLELNRCDKPIGKMAKVGFIYPELGTVDAKRLEDRLALFANVIVKPENGRLYRTITNRLWKRLLGRGIVEPVDEMDNPPWDATLLDWLAAAFIDSGYDIKYLIKTIMTSQAYQLPTVGYSKAGDLQSDYQFAGPVLRRLSAEQFSDAISQVIAPLYTAAAYLPDTEKLPAQRIWHKELKFDRVVLPEPGERYFRKVFQLGEETVRGARILISVDKAYTLFINGEKVGEGENWEEVDQIEVGHLLKSGKNVIAVQGSNEGPIANPAGVLFAMEIDLQTEEHRYIYSDNTWKSIDQLPDENWVNLGYDYTTWLPVRNYGTANWGRLLTFSFEKQGSAFARASLVKQHPFMKVLGRPSRENVATSRAEEATLLQALELTNGTFFNGVLQKGAEQWLERYQGDSETITTQLYQQLLGREPNNKEKELMLELLGDTPEVADVQDLFWTVLILPEFQFIY
ncbi:MAG: DUF1549 domain-containing protein [Bacteroidota bacterium]